MAHEDADLPPTRPSRRPWYAEGLQFECRPDCGHCCTRHGDYDYVYLDPGDVARLAGHLGLGMREFRALHTRKDDGHTILRMDGPACPFLEGARCGVYDARPTQCRTFPFWPENLASRRRWEELASFCPGIGNGPVVRLHTIREQLPHPTRT
jgi:uncharacterized protein